MPRSDQETKAIKAAEHAAALTLLNIINDNGAPSNISQARAAAVAMIAAYEQKLWVKVDPETVPRDKAVIIYNSLLEGCAARVFMRGEQIGRNVAGWRVTPPLPDW